MTKNEIQKLSEHSERLMAVETKIENVEKKLDNIDVKIDNFFVAMNNKADKAEVKSLDEKIAKINDRDLANSRQSLVQAIGIIASLIMALLALKK